jgi:hypothetical protein
MSETSTLIGYSGRTIGREELALVPTPAPTETHRPIPHHEIVQALIETLGFRHIGVVHDEYAVSPDGMKAFGVLDLATEMEGCPIWSLSNAFTSAFKELDPVPQFKATAKLGEFLETRFSQSF